MALVNVVNMTVLDNPTCFCNPFQFEITFECLQELDDDLEWRVLYVGNAHEPQYDQVLDEILVGPIPIGLNKFVLQAESPNIASLLVQPNVTVDDVLGVTVVLVTCSYKEREFVRIGYYVNNEYMNPNDDPTTIDDPLSTTTRIMEDTAMQSPTRTSCDDKPPSSTISSTTDTTPSTSHEPEHPLSSSISATQRTTITSIHDINFQNVQRTILADKPRVTKFPIPWNDTTTTTAATAATATTSSTTIVSSPPPSFHNNINNTTTTTSSSSMIKTTTTPSTIGTSTNGDDDEDVGMDTE